MRPINLPTLTGWPESVENFEPQRRAPITIQLRITSSPVLLFAALSITLLALSPVVNADSFGDIANVSVYLNLPFGQVATCNMTTHDGSLATTGCSGPDGSGSETALRNGLNLGALATATGGSTSRAAVTQANSGFSDTLTIGSTGTGQGTLVLT